MRMTGAQESYLRKLLIEAFSKLYSDRAIPYDYNHLNRITKSEASEAIAHLIAAKARNWVKLDRSVEIAAEEKRSQETRARVEIIKSLRSQGLKCSCQEPEDRATCKLHLEFDRLLGTK